MLNKTKSVTQSGGRPLTAVEISPEGALAATIHEPGESPVYAFAALAAGALVPGVAESNIHSQEAVAAAIRSALDEVSPKSRAVTLIVPDTSVRVFVLDFDSLPSKTTDVVPVLRFRLRKMVPFDVEHAALSYQILVNKPESVRVLATVLPGTILAEYEAAVRTAGYEPGAVLPSSLASLASLDSLEPILSANLTRQALTTSITSGQDLLLFRTVELPENEDARLAEVQRSIAVAAAYFEDKLVVRPRTLHYAGHQSIAEFAGLVGDPELSVVEMTTKPETGAITSLRSVSVAGIAGALAGA
jgi:type IV pilus assembly protein PilM